MLEAMLRTTGCRIGLLGLRIDVRRRLVARCVRRRMTMARQDSA
jgi:hypothetical protein